MTQLGKLLLSILEYFLVSFKCQYVSRRCVCICCLYIWELSLYTVYSVTNLESYQATLYISERWRKHISFLHYVRKQSSWRLTNGIPPSVNLQWTSTPACCQMGHYTGDNQLYQDRKPHSIPEFFHSSIYPNLLLTFLPLEQKYENRRKLLHNILHFIYYIYVLFFMVNSSLVI